MGAFGELLIKNWGGDLDRYRGNYGTKHTNKNIETTEEDKVRFWWGHCLTDDQKVDLIVKRHPECLTQSGLRRWSLWEIYNKNPQKLYNDWIKENQKTTKTFTEWLRSNESKQN
jgi:hypothetical protein